MSFSLSCSRTLLLRPLRDSVELGGDTLTRCIVLVNVDPLLPTLSHRTSAAPMVLMGTSWPAGMGSEVAARPSRSCQARREAPCCRVLVGRIRTAGPMPHRTHPTRHLLTEWGQAARVMRTGGVGVFLWPGACGVLVGAHSPSPVALQAYRRPECAASAATPPTRRL